jgi:ABC-2 type transport system permease protein
MIRWWQNPILIKEFRTRPMLQAQWLLRAVGICLIVSVLLMLLVALSVSQWVAEGARMIPDMITAVSALAIVLVLLVGPAITGGAICSDRESGVWELVRTTRLSSLRIVSGKFQSSIIPLLLLALATAPALLVTLYFDSEHLSEHWANVLRVLAVMGMTVAFVSTAGVFFSSIFSRTSAATAATYALLIAMGLGSMMVLLDREGFSERLVRTVFLLNPVAVAMDASGATALRKYGLLIPHLKLMCVVTLSMLAVAVVRVFQLRRPD